MIPSAMIDPGAMVYLGATVLEDAGTSIKVELLSDGRGRDRYWVPRVAVVRVKGVGRPVTEEMVEIGLSAYREHRPESPYPTYSDRAMVREVLERALAREVEPVETAR